MYQYFLILLLIPCSFYSYTMMFDMYSNTVPVVDVRIDQGEEYTIIDFQPALIPYRAVFQSSQAKRLLSVIKKHKEHQQNAEELGYYQKLMTISFYSIEDRRQRISSLNPSLTVYFDATGEGEQILIFSIGRIQKGMMIKPEMFYLTRQGIDELETILQKFYLAKK
ncbi:MAG: hypothetical protein ACRCWI_04565 [Brevinema sp.]